MMMVMFVIYDNVDGGIYFEDDQGHDVTSPSQSLTRVELCAVGRMRHLSNSMVDQSKKLMERKVLVVIRNVIFTL